MTDNPYQAPKSVIAEPDAAAAIELTWRRAAKIWWSLAWRTILFSGLAGMALGAILGAALGSVGKSAQEIAGVATWVGLFVGMPVAIWVVKSVFNKSWSDFRIVLVPLSPP